jgi:hypothetical protein
MGVEFSAVPSPQSTVALTAPAWPLRMRLVFQGKTPRELARQLKGPKQNGNKTLAELLHCVTEGRPLISPIGRPRRRLLLALQEPTVVLQFTASLD